MEERYTIGELSRASGVSVASIKFYVREGLLPPGDPSAPGRAYYGDAHLSRLLLVRALRDVANLPVAKIRAVLAALGRRGAPVDVVAATMDAMRMSPRPGRSKAMAQALEDVRGLLARLGVTARPDAGAVSDLAAALVRLRSAWAADLPVDALVPYAEAARALARQEVDRNHAALDGDAAQLLQTAILGTVLFEPIVLAFRRIMHEDLVRNRAPGA